jgi:hypothetical protein
LEPPLSLVAVSLSARWSHLPLPLMSNGYTSLLREMSQQTLYTLEVNRKAIIEQILKLDAEIERERQK